MENNKGSNTIKQQANTQQLNHWAAVYSYQIARHETSKSFEAFFKENCSDLYINGVQAIQGALLAYEIVNQFCPAWLAQATKEINSI